MERDKRRRRRSSFCWNCYYLRHVWGKKWKRTLIDWGWVFVWLFLFHSATLRVRSFSLDVLLHPFRLSACESSPFFLPVYRAFVCLQYHLSLTPFHYLLFMSAVLSFTIFLLFHSLRAIGNLRLLEKKILDQIIGEGHYDSRIRPSGDNATKDSG